MPRAYTTGKGQPCAAATTPFIPMTLEKSMADAVLWLCVVRVEFGIYTKLEREDLPSTQINEIEI